MNSVDATIRRYTASVALARDGVDILAVVDPDGGRFNAVAWELLQMSREDPALWEDLLPPVRALRGRLLTQPQATAASPEIAEAADEVIRQAQDLRGAVASTEFLDRLVLATREVREGTSRASETLLVLLGEGASREQVVIAASGKAQAALASWLSHWSAPGIRVLTAGELNREEAEVKRAFVVGPPRFFNSSLVTAPPARRVCFLMPTWFRDLSAPRSPFALYAEGAIKVKARVHTVEAAGNAEVPEPTPAPAPTDTGPEEELLPPALQPPPPRSFSLSQVSGTRTRGDVAAHKLILSGGLAMWLDDGERIRTLDPDQPSGNRVVSLKVQDVQPGTILLLRENQSDRKMLRAAAYEILGDRAAEVRRTQELWKGRLAGLLDRQGDDSVERDLTTLEAEHAGQVRAWTDPLGIRPRSDVDFRVVLEWLDIPIEPSFGNAGLLRQATIQAGVNFTSALEDAVNTSDLSELDQQGYLTFSGQEEGIRGMVATRVLARSDNTAFISRSKVRVPSKESAVQWHE